MSADGVNGETYVDQAALPPRVETFLAHYSRNFKLAVVTFILAILVLPWSLGRLMPEVLSSHKPVHETHVQGADALLQ